VWVLDALQELESSKQRCDWAFSERDKIVRECESIRSLCDQLRRERDSAVSELISALRDSDDMRRQKNDASRELKELRYICSSSYCCLFIVNLRVLCVVCLL